MIAPQHIVKPGEAKSNVSPGQIRPALCVQVAKAQGIVPTELAERPRLRGLTRGLTTDRYSPMPVDTSKNEMSKAAELRLGNVSRMLAAWIRRGARQALSISPEGVLRAIARMLARPRPLGLYPGWKFAIEEDDPTWDVSWRLALWREFKERGIQDPVRVRWIDGLVTDLVLGNDLSRCVYVGGSFEPNEFCLLDSLLEPGSTFVDVGANEGFYSLFAARRVAPHGRVFAFEPSPRERLRLERNIRINDLHDVRVFSEGLAEAPGNAVLHIADREHSGLNSLGEFGYSGVERVGNVEILLTTLDCLRKRGEIPRVDVLKMDVEGAEMRVLSGASETLRDDKPLVLMELLDSALRGQGSSSKEVLDFIRTAGFRVFEFDPVSGRPLLAVDEDPTSSNIVACHPDGPFVL